MKFLPFLDLSLYHDYYKDGHCPDFEIVPTKQTLRLLKNYRCILKKRPYGIQILIATKDKDITLIPLEDGSHFEFSLILTNSDFPLFTNLDDYQPLVAPIYTHAAGETTLTLSSKKAQVTEDLVVIESISNHQFVLRDKPLPELTKDKFVISGLGAVTTPTDYNQSAKRMIVNTSSATRGNHFQVTYPVILYQAQGIFADVDIQYNRSGLPLAEGAIEYKIMFNPKVVFWTYYIVADTSNTGFEINDPSEESLVFGATNRTDLNQNPDASDTLATSLAQKYPTKQRFRFISNKAVPCQQQPRKEIQLQLAGDTVLSTLPNPALQNFNFVEMTIGGVKQSKPALHQVVKYFT